MLKKYKGNIIFFFTAAVIALIVAAFYDLQTLGNTQNQRFHELLEWTGKKRRLKRNFLDCANWYAFNKKASSPFKRRF